MATLNITVDDTIAPRVIAAYGVSTAPQLKAAILKQIKDSVQAYEVGLANDAELAKIRAAQTASDTAIDTARVKAQTEIVIT